MPTQYFRNRMNGEILSEDDITYAQLKSGNWEEFTGLVRWEITTTTSAGGGSVVTRINQERGGWVLFSDISDLEMENRELRCKVEFLEPQMDELRAALSDMSRKLTETKYQKTNLMRSLKKTHKSINRSVTNLDYLAKEILSEHADLESLRQLVTSGLITDTYNEQED